MSTTTQPQPFRTAVVLPGPAPAVPRPGQDGRPGGVVPEGFVFPGTEDLDPVEVFSSPGYQAPRRRSSPWAVSALVAGLLSFIPVVGLLALVLGHVARRRIARTYDTGTAMAWAGVVLGSATSVVWLWVWMLITVLRVAS